MAPCSRTEPFYFKKRPAICGADYGSTNHCFSFSRHDGQSGRSFIFCTRSSFAQQYIAHSFGQCDSVNSRSFGFWLVVPGNNPKTCPNSCTVIIRVASRKLDSLFFASWLLSPFTGLRKGR